MSVGRFWLERRGSVWCVVGPRDDGTRWVYPASRIEVALWRRLARLKSKQRRPTK